MIKKRQPHPRENNGKCKKNGYRKEKKIEREERLRPERVLAQRRFKNLSGLLFARDKILQFGYKADFLRSRGLFGSRRILNFVFN